MTPFVLQARAYDALSYLETEFGGHLIRPTILYKGVLHKCPLQEKWCQSFFYIQNPDSIKRTIGNITKDSGLLKLHQAPIYEFVLGVGTRFDLSRSAMGCHYYEGVLGAKLKICASTQMVLNQTSVLFSILPRKCGC